VNTQTGSESNNVILCSPEMGSEDSLKSNHMGSDNFALGARSGWKISQGGAISEESEPMCQERNEPRNSQIMSGDSLKSKHMGKDGGSAFGARSGWKSSQGGANSGVSELMCRVEKDVSQCTEYEDRVLPMLSVAQPRINMVQQNNIECNVRIMRGVSVAQPRVSVDQPSNIEMRCQDDSVDGETADRQYVCQDDSVDGETGDGQYVCTVCTMQHAVCGGEGGCTFGQVSTNQKRTDSYSVNIANTNGGTSNLGEEGTRISGTFATSSSSFGNKISKQKGGGPKMKIPAIFTNSYKLTPNKNFKHTDSSGDGATLTPIKRKLVSNCNTRTLLRVFENAAGNPPTVYGGEGEMESPAKKRRCEDSEGSTNLTKPGD
jgi:hypothetical protein